MGGIEAADSFGGKMFWFWSDSHNKNIRNYL